MYFHHWYWPQRLLQPFRAHSGEFVTFSVCHDTTLVVPPNNGSEGTWKDQYSEGAGKLVWSCTTVQVFSSVWCNISKHPVLFDTANLLYMVAWFHASTFNHGNLYPSISLAWNSHVTYYQHTKLDLYYILDRKINAFKEYKHLHWQCSCSKVHQGVGKIMLYNQATLP